MRGRRILGRPIGTWALYLVTVLGFLYLFVPLVTIAVFSFNDLPEGERLNTTWFGFTLDNWTDPFAASDFRDALVESLKVAFFACILATALGALVALAIARYRMRGGALINLLIVLPLTTPEIVMGFSLFSLFFNRGAERGFGTVVLAHTMFCLSFVALTVKARVQGLDWSLEDAAGDLGSPPLRTFAYVTLPLIVPGIAAAFLLSVALSIDDYIITSFVAGNLYTFHREVFDASTREIPTQVHVLTTIIMAVSIVIIVGSTLWGNRRSRVAT